MTQPTVDKARTRLAAFLGYEPDEHDALFESHLAAYRAAVLREAAALVRAGAEDDDFNAPEYGSHENVLEAADMLHRMAEEARS